jgi:hypothetical protein
LRAGEPGEVGEGHRGGDRPDGSAAPGAAAIAALALRLLGLVYLDAFLSLLVQIQGLVGSRGILPAAEFLERVAAQTGPERYWLLPTVFWAGCSDVALKAACVAGSVVGLLLVAGISWPPLLLAAWALYLSLVGVGQVFLGYQWDALLLEAGFLAVFLPPPRLLPSRDAGPPSRVIVWLFRWLLFRLMFSSGIAKLTSGDPTWRSLSALRYHYETQPLPTPLAWWGHHLPPALQAASVGLMLAVEGLAPFLLFAPARWRSGAFVPFVALQVLIALTGNYGFFNALTIVLCLFALDDTRLPPRLCEWLRPARVGPPWPRILAIPLAVTLVVVSLVPLCGAARVRLPLPSPLRTLASTLAAFDVVNGYGLFAVMTTTRPEIVIERSDDLVTWTPYAFRYKPGDVRRAPPWVAPHQPRLDWQMWFASLSSCAQEDWMPAFLVRLLQGEPSVLALLPEQEARAPAPRFVRATTYDYHFTTAAEARATGDWWRGERTGPYCPVLTLTSDGPRVVTTPGSGGPDDAQR